MTALVLAPHPDDEAIGCGGALALRHRAGERTVVVFLTSGELGIPGLAPDRVGALREAEAAKAAVDLGIERLVFLREPDARLADHAVPAAAALRAVLCEEDPDVVYVPHADEWHPDHAVVRPILEAAARDRELPELLSYEIWTPLARPDTVIDVSAVMDVKLAALRCYASQLEQFRYDDAISGLNRYRGILYGGCRYAEAFLSGGAAP